MVKVPAATARLEAVLRDIRDHGGRLKRCPTKTRLGAVLALTCYGRLPLVEVLRMDAVTASKAAAQVN